MKYAIMLLTVFSFALADNDTTLLDDFNRCTGVNRLRLNWYYFSDENNEGNSVIHNATRKKNGGYSDIAYDTVGNDTDFCGTIEFTFGTNEEVYDMDGNEFEPFVGIGTDLAPRGSSIDIGSLDTITFRARSKREMVVYVEIMSRLTGDDNYCDFGDAAIVTPEWNTCTLLVDDDHFRQPGWTRSADWLPLSGALSSAVKLNWILSMSYNERIDSIDCLYIDDVVLHGVDLAPETGSLELEKYMVPSPGLSGEHRSGFDLLGRSVELSRIGHRPLPGVTILRNGDDSRKLFTPGNR